jgi:alpha-galactosidase
MRIGADVDRHWHPFHFGTEFFFKSDPDLPSTRNAIHNSLTRAALHRRWWVNDPDCLLLDPDMPLTQDEVNSLATAIAMTGGALIISGDLPGIPPERLRIAWQLLPVIGLRPRLMDWFDTTIPAHLRLDLVGAAGQWQLITLINWSDQPQEMTLKLEDYDLPPGLYYLHEFWSGKLARIEGDALPWQIPAHGVALFSVHPAQSPQYIGSDLHISQGQEVKNWSVSDNPRGVNVTLERPGRAAGNITLCLPQPPQRACLNGNPIEWQPVGESCYQFSVVFERTALLEVHW